MTCSSLLFNLDSPWILVPSTTVPFFEFKSVIVISDRARGDNYVFDQQVNPDYHRRNGRTPSFGLTGEISMVICFREIEL